MKTQAEQSGFQEFFMFDGEDVCFTCDLNFFMPASLATSKGLLKPYRIENLNIQKFNRETGLYDSYRTLSTPADAQALFIVLIENMLNRSEVYITTTGEGMLEYLSELQSLFEEKTEENRRYYERFAALKKRVQKEIGRIDGHRTAI